MIGGLLLSFLLGYLLPFSVICIIIYKLANSEFLKSFCGKYSPLDR